MHVYAFYQKPLVYCRLETREGGLVYGSMQVSTPENG